MSHELFSMGNCPVCADSGTVAVLVARHDGSFVFYCPLCEVAWTEPPAPHTLDEVHDLRALAPQGTRLPTSAEINQLARRGNAPIAIEWTDWAEFLDVLAT